MQFKGNKDVKMGENNVLTNIYRCKQQHQRWLSKIF